ncbi:hypothetical protein [Streptomyces sp. NPDC046832]
MTDVGLCDGVRHSRPSLSSALHAAISQRPTAGHRGRGDGPR